MTQKCLKIAVKSVADLPFTNESKFLLSKLPDSAWSLNQYSLIILTFGKQMRPFQLIPPFFLGDKLEIFHNSSVMNSLTASQFC